jgi:hypothetical protein
MLPVLREGDEVVARRMDLGAVDELGLGDLLVVDLPGAGLVVHRFLLRRGGELRTRGDGSGVMDPPVPVKDVLARVEEVRRGEQDVTPGPWSRRVAWLRGFTAAAAHRLRRRILPDWGDPERRATDRS